MTPTTERVAARVIVIDRDDAVLLLRGRDPARPDGGWWWFTPGGGLEPGESPAAGARRELFEETGLDAPELGEPVFFRETEFDFEHVHYRQRETLFAVRAERFEPNRVGWSEIERRSLGEHRWWSLEEMDATTETIHPENLATIVRTALRDVDR